MGFSGGFLHLLQGHARFDLDGVVDSVDSPHPIQPGERKHQGASGVIGRGTSRETRVATLRHHRNAVGAAPGEHGGHIGGAVRLGDCDRPSGPLAAPVREERRHVRWIGDEAASKGSTQAGEVVAHLSRLQRLSRMKHRP